MSLRSGRCPTLEELLRQLGARSLVITGFAANLCVAFTANDGHMRGYQNAVPSDCTASNSPRTTRQALEHAKTALQADVRPEAQLDLVAFGKRPKKPRGQPFRG